MFIKQIKPKTFFSTSIYFTFVKNLQFTSSTYIKSIQFIWHDIRIKRGKIQKFIFDFQLKILIKLVYLLQIN